MNLRSLIIMLNAYAETIGDDAEVKVTIGDGKAYAPHGSMSVLALTDETSPSFVTLTCHEVPMVEGVAGAAK